MKVPVRVESVRCERKHRFEEDIYALHAQLGLVRNGKAVSHKWDGILIHGNAVLFDTPRGGLNRSSVFYQMLIGVGYPTEEQWPF